MKLWKIKYRNPALDTKGCYCINNFLWAKDKIQILNNKEFLAPKYYTPRHIATLESQRLATAKYLGSRPLKNIKKQYEDKKKREFKNRRKRQKTTDRIYKFHVNVSYNEYEVLWNVLYKELRNPITDRSRISTIQEVEERRLRKLNDEKEKNTRKKQENN